MLINLLKTVVQKSFPQIPGAVAVLLWNSTAAAPGFRSRHLLLWSLHFIAKGITMLALSKGSIRQSNPFMTKFRKKELSLNSGNNCRAFRRPSEKVSQPTFSKLSCLPLPAEEMTGSAATDSPMERTEPLQVLLQMLPLWLQIPLF